MARRGEGGERLRDGKGHNFAELNQAPRIALTGSIPTARRAD
jgi:hypothetical protein